MGNKLTKEEFKRTPGALAAAAFMTAMDSFISRCIEEKQLGKDEVLAIGERLIKEVFGEIFSSQNLDGSSLEATLIAEKDKLNSFRLIDAFKVVATYTTQVVRAEQSGQVNDAWFYAAQAQRWAVFMKGLQRRRTEKTNPAAELARLRHAENYALAKLAIDHWRENIDPQLSAAKAANELLSIVPLSHKKLAELVSSEKRKIKKP